MYLSRIELKNIRVFDKIAITLPSANQVGATWSVITGDNGTGKTTLLRCIAMAISGESGASGLLTELFGEWLRNRAEIAEITLELEEPNDTRKRHLIKTTMRQTQAG